MTCINNFACKKDKKFRNGPMLRSDTNRYVGLL